jgi:hypothetical protein
MKKSGETDRCGRRPMRTCSRRQRRVGHRIFYKADSLSAMMTERIRLGEQFALFLYVREFGIILYPRAVIVCYCHITFSRSY